MNKRILCVGTEVVDDRRLQQSLANMNAEWGVMFSGSGTDALALMDRLQFDAVVADFRLPNMDGAQLLNTITERHAQSKRVILCDASDRDSLIKCVGAVHHYLSRPWDAQQVRAVLERAFTLDVWLSNHTVRKLIARMHKLPSPPDLYFQVVRALQSPEADIEQVGSLIARDLAMTAKLLQLANSAVLGLRRKVTSAQEAVMYLGLETTRSLILLAHTFSYFDRAKIVGFSLESLWRHSLNTGSLARCIAEVQNAPPELVDESFTAGLLHDIGKLMLAANIADEYGRVTTYARDKKVSLWEAELEILGATHAEVGADLLAIWNLPLSTVEALALHHYPTKLVSKAFSSLTAVHVANALEHEFNGSPEALDWCVLDSAYLADLELTGQVDTWREKCRAELEKAAADKPAGGG